MIDYEQLAAIFRALGNPTRLSLVAELARIDANGSGEASAMGLTELAKRVEVSRFAAGFHLDQLREAGVVERTQVGARSVHSLARDAMDAIDLWLCETAPLTVDALFDLDQIMPTGMRTPT